MAAEIVIAGSRRVGSLGPKKSQEMQVHEQVNNREEQWMTKQAKLPAVKGCTNHLLLNLTN